MSAYPGTVVIVLGGYEFIRATMAGDEYEVAPFADQKAETLRTIAGTLAYRHGSCVLLPPLAAKFGLDPLFDENTARMAEILAEQGIMYYRPAMWNQLQLFDQFHPLDTVNNRRVYTRTFQCLLRLTEWYGMVRDKYCSNGSLETSETGEVTRTFHPHNCDPDRFIVPTTWRNADTEAEMNRLRRIPVKMRSAQDIANAMGASQAKAEQLYYCLLTNVRQESVPVWFRSGWS